ncbi:MAG: multicopper oxidase domain-containing protein [Candidatus Eremiobacteraeota bacterium]|nr:multicopper oxidase domain-containing protein [Candidatus Eremiobacteraeota bacterium]
MSAALLSMLVAATGIAPAQQLPPVTAQVTDGTIDVPATDAATLDLLPPLAANHTVYVKLALIDKVVEIAPGIKYRAWTFNGVVPGPVIHARVGDRIDVTLTNKASMGHSIDFHAALAPPNVAYQTVEPGKTLHFSWVASSPGAFLYHCGTQPVLMHISNGMYGAIVVDPTQGWGSAAQSYVFVQSEFYPKRIEDTEEYSGDMLKMQSGVADVVDFNGLAFQYMKTPLPISVGKLVRLFVVNAGPSHFSAFHVVGTLLRRSYVDGNPANLLVGLQTLSIPPGGGAVTEFTVLQAGKYAFVTHAFGDADAGAMGIFLAK